MGLFGDKEERKRKRLEREAEDKKRMLDKKVLEAQKAEEELNMVKLELKDGKLQKVDEKKEVIEPPLQPRVPSLAEQQAEEMVRRQTEAMMAQMEQEAMQREAYQQQMAQQQQMAAMAQQQQQLAALAQQQQMAAMAQAQAQAQVQQQTSPPNTVTMHILMTEGREAKEEIYSDELQAIIEDLNEAIASCTSIPFGSRVLNGRYILEYMYY
jgi:FtsZ-interacting cell division protein ZipA